MSQSDVLHDVIQRLDIGLEIGWKLAYMKGSAWLENAPFAFWLAKAAKPRLLVELGVHTGVSFMAFCQSVAAFGLDTRCFGIDHWKGDEQAGFYDGNAIFEPLNVYNDAHYAAFASLLRRNFDDARSSFADHEIDVLHIDGFHAYDSVTHDFSTWESSLSDSAIVVFHDINVRTSGFGVWKFWKEITERYPSFSFHHGAGLGVLGYGKNPPAPLKELFSLTGEEGKLVRSLFSARGFAIKDFFWEQQRAKTAETGWEAHINIVQDEWQKQHDATKARLDEAVELVNFRDEELAGLRLKIEELLAGQHRQEIRATESNDLLARREAELRGLLEENKRLAAAGDETEKYVAELSDLLSVKDAQLAEQDVLLGKIYGAFRNNATRAGNALRLSSLLLKREEELTENRRRLDELSAGQREKEETITRYADRFLELQKEKVEKDTRVLVLDKSVREMRAALESGKDELARIQKQKAEKESHVQMFGALVDEMRTVLDNSANEVSRLQKEKAEKDSRVQALDASVEDMRVVLESSKKELFRARQEMKNKEGHIEELLVRDRELEQIKSSRMWALMRSVWGVSRAVLPYDSRRRLLFETGYMFARHPLRFLGRVSSTRVNLFFRTLRREGAAETLRRVKRVIGRTAMGAPKVQLQLTTQEPVKTDDAAATWDVLTFPVFETPVVSIIIPAYNQLSYTYQCLGSILRNSGDVPYEVIVADDCSTDKTRELDTLAKNINVIHNKENLQFVRNCNNAAQQARGEFILFLNNDTQVQPDWLRPLVELMRKDPKIGMTGSKLVFPDGTLQEAGGIFWKDASAWNYGRGDDPALPDYNYVRETDYITGAALMIRRELWNEIGGFDTRYVPAYCEDADLAFEVRKHGYKVVYQPESVVVHFEGKTHGTDVNSGIKAYQVTNQKKFFEKWRDVLERDHFPNGENVFLARGRSRARKTILMVDHYVPQFDRDAGSRSVYCYIRLLREMNVDVIFIPDNFHYDERYVRDLQQMGVFVLYGSHYYNHWKDWLRDIGGMLDGVFLNRPHISIKYIDLCRRVTKGKILYYGHDLHYLRERREYELTGDKATLAASENWKKIELELIGKVDVCYYPSSFEVGVVKKTVPAADCRVLPVYVYPDVEQKEFSRERSDLMFVGGFRHTPNVDGVLWFAREIMPILRKQKPDVRFIIVGSNAPENIRALDGDGIVFKGEVSDAELQEIYASCRICVAPLRYGAGVKGKVVEAMYNQIPLVTTSIGAEGLDGVERVIRVRDNANAFAAAILEMYDDFKLLKKMTKREYTYIINNFSSDRAGKVIRGGFDFQDEPSRVGI